MQFDDFDKKIIDAAEHHHPAYDEKAWEKMEVLLNKHLPVKKDGRRRIIFFLLLFMLIGSGAFFVIHTFNKHKVPVAATLNKESKDGHSEAPAATTKSLPVTRERNEKSGNPAVDLKTETAAGTGTKSLPADVTKTGKNNPDIIPTVTTGKNNSPVAGVAAGEKNKTVIAQALSTARQQQVRQPETTLHKAKGGATVISKKGKGNTTGAISGHKTSPVTKEGNDTDSGTVTPENSSPGETVKATPRPLTVDKNADGPGKGASAANRDTVSQKTGVNEKTSQEEKPASVIAKKNIKNPARQKRSFFAINFSAGPDLSFVGISELGKLKMRYGAGLGYTLNHFTLRSGFYVSTKIYSAEGTYYHPFYASLEKVDGDCKVYEIPVTISYNFARAKNHSWFASTGLSSYLMKKETYGYHTKDPATGNTNFYTRAWDNKNKHYFSVLNLSAGYERYFSRTISLIAEPYLQLPFSGVGNGKMKLFSSGIQFTLSVKTFGGKK